MTYKVLVIEDHREIADLVKMHLNDIDCRAKMAFDGPRAWPMPGPTTTT